MLRDIRERLRLLHFLARRAIFTRMLARWRPAVLGGILNMALKVTAHQMRYNVR